MIHYHFVTSVLQGQLPHSRYLLLGHKYLAILTVLVILFVTKSTCKSCLWLCSWILCAVLAVCGLFTLIGRNFKDLLIIGFLYSTNEHNIAIDLNRFQVASGVVKKV